MKSVLRPVMLINIEGMEEFERCADNVIKSAQKLEEAVQEFNECKLTIDACPKAEEKTTTDKVVIGKMIGTGYSLDECETSCDTQFGREDLDDIISDLQEEYYRLDRGKYVTLKIKIADLIDRLCRLRETIEE